MRHGQGLFLESVAMNAHFQFDRLPSGVRRLSRGGLHVLSCHDEAAPRLALVGSALRAALDQGLKALLVTSAEPEDFLTGVRLTGVFLEGDWREQRLGVLRLPADLATRLRERGAREVTNLLDSLTGSTAHVVVFEDARVLLPLGDPRQCRAILGQYADWVGRHGHTALAFVNARAAAAREQVALAECVDVLAGFARLRGIGTRPVLDVVRWPGHADRFSQWLEWSARCELRDVGRTSDTAAEQQARADGPVLAAPASFSSSAESLSAMNGRCAWTAVDSESVLVAESIRQRARCVVLGYADSRDQETLVAMVLELRSAGPVGMHIVVRECGARLRLPFALTLMQLGVSLVVPDGVSDQSAIMSIQPLLNQPFVRICDTDILRVGAECQTVLESKPRDGGEFRESVERLLALTQTFELRHSLVRLYVRPQGRESALSSLRENGRDLLAASDSTQIWVFLFSCQPTDARRVLERVFGEQLQNLFSDWSISAEPQRMLAALESIRGPVGSRRPVQALDRELTAA